MVGYDRSPELQDVDSLEALVGALQAPRVVWVMVPAGDPTRETVEALGNLLEAGDVVVDGGNSKFTDDQVHADLLATKGIGYVDAGVSGGVGSAERLRAHGRRVEGGRRQGPADLRRPQAAGRRRERLPGRRGCGLRARRPVGAGHFAKMVHNGIEYAMMQAYGEGYELLAAVDLVEDVPGVIASWTQGTVIRSWLLDLLVRALQEDPGLDDITGWAADSGEGRWTVEQAIEHAVPMPAISASLFAPVLLPAGRQPDHEGRRGAAEPVRRPRGQGPRGRGPGLTASQTPSSTSAPSQGPGPS